MIESSEADWARENPRKVWDPGAQLIKCIRTYQRHKQRSGLHTRIRLKFVVLQHRFWSVVTGADIPLNTKIEGGFMIPHPNGVVVSSASVIGANCVLLQQTTLGKSDINSGSPVLGQNVFVGAGAKILGPVTIGNYAKIGANAVVLRDVPANATAVGIPARIIY